MNDPGLENPIADHADAAENEVDDEIDIGEGQAYIHPRCVSYLIVKYDFCPSSAEKALCVC